MNASELADKLEYWRERVCDSQDIDNDRLSMSGFANIAFNNTREIAKSLRFAADIERLLDCKDREIVFRKLSGGGIQASSMWRENAELRVFDEVFSCVDDIYTAARNAVEKLEGK